jgi:hypothetical protein
MLLAMATAFSQAQPTETKLMPPASPVYLQYGTTVAINGNWIMAASDRVTNNVYGGRVFVYQYTEGAWTQKTILQENTVCANALNYHQYGDALACEGEFFVVGAPQWDSDCNGSIGPDGSAFVYTNKGGPFTLETHLKDPAFHVNENFGCSVAIDGEQILVGANAKTVGAASWGGSVFAFTRQSSGNWTLQQSFAPADLASNDQFGTSVDFDGSWAVAGAPGSDGSKSNQGAAYFYKLVGGTWTQMQKVNQASLLQNAEFGTHVSISGEWAAVGSSYSNNRNRVTLFRRSGDTWSLFQTISKESEAGDFGYEAVAIDGLRLVVGADGSPYSSGEGKAFAYEFNGTTWVRTLYLQASDGQDGNRYGCSVAIGGGKMTTGAFGDPGPTGNSAGAAYIYNLVNCNLTVNATDDVWQNPGEVGRLLAMPSGGTAPYTYLWEPATGLSDPTAAAPTCTLNSTTTYTLTATDANNCTATDEATVNIANLGDIEGHVRDLWTNQPVSNASVQAFGTRNLTTTTSAEGYYSLADLPEGWYTVVVEHADYQTGTNSNVQVIYNTSQTYDFNLAPSNAATLTGEVRDAVSSITIGQATVTINELSLEAETNWDGTYSFANIAPGTYTISVTHPSYTTKTVNNYVLQPSQTQTLNLNLTPEVRVWTGAVNTSPTEENNWNHWPIDSYSHLQIPIVANNRYPVFTMADMIFCQRVTVEAGAKLTVQEGQLGASLITIKGNASNLGSLVYNEAINCPNIIAEQYISSTGLGAGDRSWHYITPMGDGVQASTFATGLVNWYDEPTQLWQEVVDPTAQLTAMKGYSVAMPANTTVSHIGQFIRFGASANFTRTNAAGAYGQGFNLTGNPYPSAVDLEIASVSGSQIDNTFYFWDQTQSGGLGNYLYYNTTTGGTKDQYAAAGQGFFVRVSDGYENGSLQISPAAGVHQSATLLKQQTAADHLLKVTVAKGTYTDAAVLRFGTGYEATFSGAEDALKLFNTAVPQLFTNSDDNLSLAVQGRPFSTDEQQIPLNLRTTQTGTFTLTFDGVESFDALNSLQLDDLKLRQTITITPGLEYEFAVEDGDAENRFTLRFGNVTGTDETLQSNFEVWSIPQAIVVSQTGTPHQVNYVLSDLSGRTIAEGKTKGEAQERIGISTATGCYLFTLISGTETQTWKLILQ